MKKLNYKELQDLFIKVKNGNENSFKELYESTYRSQYFLAFNYIKNQTLAEEAVQNMYIAFYNNLEKINNDMAIIQWMNITTINECKTLIKKEKLNDKVDIDNYEEVIIDTKPNPEESYRRKEERDTLNKALDRLEPQLKEIIIYRFIDNLKIKEISRLTNLSTATINRYVKSGTMKLRAYIKNIENNLYGFVLTPYFFKLFNDCMNNQVSNKQIIDSYSKFVSKAGLTTLAGISGTGVAIGATKKGITTAGKAAIGSGAAIATTATVVAIAISPNYTITMLDADYVLSQVVSVSSNNIDQIKNISCFKDDELVAELNKDNNYTIEILENGQYTIVIKDIVGKTQKENVEINNIDYECPNVNVIKNGDIFEATISDSKSGIDYNRIQIINQDNENVDFELNGNIITFTSNNQSTTLTVYDCLGNKKKIILNN